MWALYESQEFDVYMKVKVWSSISQAKLSITNWLKGKMDFKPTFSSSVAKTCFEGSSKPYYEYAAKYVVEFQISFIFELVKKALEI